MIFLVFSQIGNNWKVLNAFDLVVKICLYAWRSRHWYFVYKQLLTGLDEFLDGRLLKIIKISSFNTGAKLLQFNSNVWFSIFPFFQILLDIISHNPFDGRFTNKLKTCIRYARRKFKVKQVKTLRMQHYFA